MQRPALAALLAYVREGDVVIAAAIDRLGRNTIDVLNTVEALKTKGVSVVSMREGFDLATPAGKLMLTMLAAVAGGQATVSGSIKQHQKHPKKPAIAGFFVLGVYSRWRYG